MFVVVVLLLLLLLLLRDVNGLLEEMEVNAKASVRNVAVVTRIIIITSVVAFVGTIRRGMILQFDAVLYGIEKCPLLLQLLL